MSNDVVVETDGLTKKYGDIVRPGKFVDPGPAWPDSGLHRSERGWKNDHHQDSRGPGPAYPWIGIDRRSGLC